MRGFEDLVEETVQDPLEIRISKIVSTGLAYISPPGVGPSPEGIRVLVDYDDMAYQKGASTGMVTTAYPVDLIRYSNPQIGRVIYRKRGGK
jgi:hypothetical protein